jgi:hypothetical protein
MEPIMTTLTMRPQDIASVAAPAPTATGLVARLVATREASARRQAVAYLAAQTDARLEGLGFSAGDIRAIRKGEMRAPSLTPR